MSVRDLFEITPQRKLRLLFHPGQWRVWNSKARTILMLAGAQSGKTAFGPHWLFREISTRGPGDYLVATPHFTLLQKKALPEFLRIFDKTLHLGEYKSGSSLFVFSDDGQRRVFGKVHDQPTQVFFGHAANSDTLESMTAKAAWLDEAGQRDFKQESNEAIDARLALNQGRKLITTTPYNLGWLYRLVYKPWEDKEVSKEEVECISFDSLDNPSFSREEYERLRKTLPAWKFDMRYRGKFTRPAGWVYDCFDEKLHTCPPFWLPPEWRRYLGLDFGKINLAGIFLAEEPGTHRVFAYREYKPGETRTLREHIDALLRGERGTPTAVGGSGSEDDWRDGFGSLGLPVRVPDVTGAGSVDVGIERVYAALRRGDLTFFSNLEMTLSEIGSYSHVLDEEGEPIDEIEDKSSYHLMDALRYIVGWLFRAGGGAVEPPLESARSEIMRAPAGVFVEPERGESISFGGW